MKESLESPKNKENFLESLLFKVFPIRLFKKLSVLTGEYFRTVVRVFSIRSLLRFLIILYLYLLNTVPMCSLILINYFINPLQRLRTS